MNKFRQVLNFLLKDIYFKIFLFVYFAYLIVTGLREYIWTDEGFSLMTSSQSISYAFEKAITIEFQPPLFYVLLNIWRNLGDSYLVARLFSILLLFVSVFPLLALFKKLFGDRYKIFTILFLTNIFVLVSALEIRYQTQMLLLTILAEYYFLITYFTEKPKMSRRVIYSIVAVLGVYTQYYFSFLLVANFVVLLANKKFRESVRYMFDMIWPVLGLALLLPFFSSQVSSQSSLCQPEFNIMFYPKFFIQSIFKLLISFPQSMDVRVKVIGWAIATGVIIVFPLIYAKWKTLGIELLKSQYFLKIILLFFLFAGMATVIKYDLLPTRHLIVVFVPFWILCFTFINQINSDKLVNLVAIVLVSISLSISVYQHTTARKGMEFKAVINYISENEKPGENIVVYRNILKLNLIPGYKGPNSIYSLPCEIDYTKAPDLYEWSIKNYKELDSVMARIPSGPMWLITTKNSSLKEIYCVDFHDEILEAYVRDNFAILSERKIDGLLVRKLQKNKKIQEL